MPFNLCVDTVVRQIWVEFAADSRWIGASIGGFTRKRAPFRALINDALLIYEAARLTNDGAFSLLDN